MQVLVIDGPDSGLTMALGADAVVVGSDAACTLALRDPSVSRRHLQLCVRDGAIEVSDLSSTNGTFYRGARITTALVDPGAVLSLGVTKLKLVEETDETAAFPVLVGASAVMRDVKRALAGAAGSDLDVLLEGETGTGKTLAAEALHASSARAQGPLFTCDLLGLDAAGAARELFGDERTPGAFVAADGGTLILEQVNEIDGDVQRALLRAIERREVRVDGRGARRFDVRIVTTSNRDLADDVADGRFRADLYHRLAAMPVRLPPLRARRDDVPILLQHFLAGTGANPAAPDGPLLQALAAHDWPGNVRELRNVVERAVALCPGDPLGPLARMGLPAAPIPRATEARPARGERTVPFKQAKERLLEAWERDYLVGLLDRAGGNISLAARRAGLNRQYLHEMLRRYELPRPADPADATKP